MESVYAEDFMDKSSENLKKEETMDTFCGGNGSPQKRSWWDGKGDEKENMETSLLENKKWGMKTLCPSEVDGIWSTS